MNSYIKFFLIVFCILSFIACSTVETVEIKEQNQFNKIVLDQNDFEIILPIESRKIQYMILEFLLSHPSKFNVTCDHIDVKRNETNETEEIILPEDPQNANIFYFNDKVQAAFIHPKRKLASVFVIDQKENLGKNKVVFALEEDMESVVINITKKEEAELNGDEAIIVKYSIVENYDEDEEEKYALKKDEIKLAQEKDMLNITFDGIKYAKNIDCKNVTVNYEIKLYDNQTLYKKYENIYVYSLLDAESDALFSTNLPLKGEMTQKENYIVIKAPENDGKEQLLLIDAKIKNLEDEEEELLQYQAYFNIIVKEKSEDRKWPDDDIKPDNKTDPKKKDDKIDPEKNRKENRNTLILILSLFGGSVVITFIGVFIYIKFCAKKDINIEEEQDYKDVGGIVTSKEDKDKDKMETKEDGPKINEEEE